MPIEEKRVMTSSPPSPPGQPAPGWRRSTSPYHAGEQAAQALAGTRELAERAGRRVIRDFMPDQHREFYARLPFIIVGSLDAAGRAWASILVGQPGFVQSPDPYHLAVAAQPLANDPLSANLRPNAALGLLGIEFATRRRNRVNGRVVEIGSKGFTLGVDLSFGNCAQYIQARSVSTVVAPSAAGAREVVRVEGPILSSAAAALVRSADTFFIASASVHGESGDPTEGADVNHRGGKPGFIKVDERDGATELTVPDFAGNSAFSTFGNLLRNPTAGLLFLDFAAPHALMLTGQAQVLWDSPALKDFPGALRFLRFRVAEGLLLRDAVPLRWSPPEPARQIAATGTWAGVQAPVRPPAGQAMAIAAEGSR